MHSKRFFGKREKGKKLFAAQKAACDYLQGFILFEDGNEGFSKGISCHYTDKHIVDTYA